MCILGIGAICVGIYTYRTFDAHRFDFPLEYVHLFTYPLVIIILEIIFQKSLKKENPIDIKKEEY